LVAPTPRFPLPPTNNFELMTKYELSGPHEKLSNFGTFCDEIILLKGL